MVLRPAKTSGLASIKGEGGAELVPCSAEEWWTYGRISTGFHVAGMLHDHSSVRNIAYCCGKYLKSKNICFPEINNVFWMSCSKSLHDSTKIIAGAKKKYYDKLYPLFFVNILTLYDFLKSFHLNSRGSNYLWSQPWMMLNT